MLLLLLLQLGAETQTHQLQALHQLVAAAGRAGRAAPVVEGGLRGATVVATTGGAVLSFVIPPSTSTSTSSSAPASTPAPSVPTPSVRIPLVRSRGSPSLPRRFTLPRAAAAPVAPRAARRPLTAVSPVPAVAEARVLVQAPAVALGVVVARLGAGARRAPPLALAPVVSLLRGARGRGGAGAQAAGVSGHVHLEAAEFGRQALVHVEVVVRLALLLEDLVEHRGALPGGEAIGDGGGLAAQDHLGREGRRILLFFLLLIFHHPEKT